MSNQVDFVAVSVDVVPEVKVKEKVTVTVTMRNNGPDVLPAGEATVQLTLSSVHFGKPLTFKSVNKRFNLVGIQNEPKNQHNVFIRSAKELPVGKDIVFSFNVKGKKPTLEGETTAITLASSLSGDATSSDIKGDNQSLVALLTVK